MNSQENPSIVRVHLKRSKYDQFGKGADVFMGCTHTPLCPVAASLGFMARHGNRQGPFFMDAQLGTVTKAWFTEQIRGHSFRIGAATKAALAGIEDSMIQMLGRWHSAVFLQYIRMPKEQLTRLSPVMATAI